MLGWTGNSDDAILEYMINARDVNWVTLWECEAGCRLPNDYIREWEDWILNFEIANPAMNKWQHVELMYTDELGQRHGINETTTHPANMRRPRGWNDLPLDLPKG